MQRALDSQVVQPGDRISVIADFAGISFSSSYVQTTWNVVQIQNINHGDNADNGDNDDNVGDNWDVDAVEAVE